MAMVGFMRHEWCKVVKSLQNDLPKIAQTICDTWRFKPESSAVRSVRAASACSARLSKAVLSSAQVFLSISNFFFNFSCAATLNSNLALAFRVSISRVFRWFFSSEISDSSFLQAAYTSSGLQFEWLSCNVKVPSTLQAKTLGTWGLMYAERFYL